MVYDSFFLIKNQVILSYILRHNNICNFNIYYICSFYNNLKKNYNYYYKKFFTLELSNFYNI